MNGRVLLASMLRVFHAVHVVMNQSLEYAMSAEVVNDMMTTFIISCTDCWSERFSSKLSNGPHCITHITLHTQTGAHLQYR